MESKTQTTLPGDPPLLPGELLSYIGNISLFCLSFIVTRTQNYIS